MDVDFKINGLKELNRELKALPEDMRNKALNGAVGAATRVLRDEAIQNAPVDSGNLKSAIFSGIAPKSKRFSKWVSMYRVGIRKRGKITPLSQGGKKRSNLAYYAKFIEEGGFFRGGRVPRPAQPFMRPAFDSKKEEAVRTFRTVLGKRVAFYQRKIARLRK